MSYMAAADAVVSMGGYNTICEILSAEKPAVVIPRVRPSQEQLVRSAKMADLGLFKTIHPDQLTPESLLQTLLQQLSNQHKITTAIRQVDCNANHRIVQQICELVGRKIRTETVSGDRTAVLAA
jgi:predicted glycosyltransferase